MKDDESATFDNLKACVKEKVVLTNCFEGAFRKLPSGCRRLFAAVHTEYCGF